MQRGGGAKVTLFETKTKSQQRNTTKKRVTGVRLLNKMFNKIKITSGLCLLG